MEERIIPRLSLKLSALYQSAVLAYRTNVDSWFGSLTEHIHQIHHYFLKPTGFIPLIN